MTNNIKVTKSHIFVRFIFTLKAEFTSNFAHRKINIKQQSI